jgi:PAS domain S-box-containing protein
MVGYSQDKLIGMRTAEHFPDEDYWWSLWESARSDLEQGGRFSGECQMRRRDGTAFWANISGSLVDASDMSRGRLWTILDISRRKQAEEDIRAALAREKELSELKSRFVSMTSHEFRTPLATILSSVELLRDYGGKLPREERAELVGLIEAAVQHMAGMLDDVLAIGRAESGKLAFRPEPIALRALCERLPEDAMGAVPGAACRRGDLVVDLAAVPERARARRRARVLGGRRGDRAAARGPAAALLDLLPRGQRRPHRRHGAGAGDRQALRRAARRAHRGRARRPTRHAVHGVAAYFGGILMARILVIEDEGPIRANVRRFLTLLGHEVAEAADGRAGLERLRERVPDLVLCDILMPELDGFGVLAALRADPSTAAIPFVFLTASADKKEHADGLARGADAYVTKPFHLKDLESVIEALLAPR